MKNNPVTQKVIRWLERDEKFCDLILTPDGHLFADPHFEERADWFAIYYDGNICVRPDNLFCLGALPRSCITFPIYVGECAVYSNGDSQFVLRGEDPILGDDSSVFAVFRFGNLLGMYTADAMFSHRIYFKVEANTPENRCRNIEGFFQQMDRHDPEIRKRVEAWLVGQGNSWKEE